MATLWLISVAAWDSATRRIPNWLVLPVALLGVGWQVYALTQGRSEGLAFTVISWLVLYTMWRAHVFGGGDAKFLMALFAMFPTTQFLLLFSLVVLAVSIPLVVWQAVGPRLRGLRGETRRDSQTPGVLSSAERLRVRGRPYSWTFALPGVLYLWLHFF
jgi:hypothetical protein